MRKKTLVLNGAYYPINVIGWKEAMAKNAWTPALLTGKAFDDFVDADFANLRGTMHLAGML